MKNIFPLFLLLSLFSCTEKENPTPSEELKGIYSTSELLKPLLVFSFGLPLR